MLVDLLRGSLTLDTVTFARIFEQPLTHGLLVVALAALSNTLGQSVALFAHRVSPRRFAASVAVEALLFVGGYALWALAIWALANLSAGTPTQPLLTVLSAIGFAHAPLLLAFLALTPYFGAPLGSLLSVWTLLACVTATAVLYQLPAPQAALYAGSGWLLAYALQRGLGRPLQHVGRRVVQRFRARERTRALP
jgi:ABC-type multidrug transport system fused ATPase/permease subunit